MGKVLHVFTFVLGVFICWLFMDNYNGDILELFQVAYEKGKQDGYRLGHAERDIQDYPLLMKEHMCMFLYKDN